MKSPFSVNVTPDWEGLVKCVRREGTPSRVHHIELFLDGEVQNAISERYGIADGLDSADPFFPHRRQIAVQSFLGYDYVGCGLDARPVALFKFSSTTDSAQLQRAGGRNYMEEHKGPITNWEEFEKFPWPDPESAPTRSLEWCSENLPDNMCLVAGLGNFAEWLTWLMGYETLCLSLYDQRDLVKSISDRTLEIFSATLKRLLQFDRVKLFWGADDMGFRSATLISPADLREFVLPKHKTLVEMAHAAGRPYMLHSCGNLNQIMDDLVNDVKIDAKHSFEDAIEPVTVAKKKYGDRLALLGGIDVDFMCRATEAQVRKRVRDTLDVCMPGGGYCLGTGNSVANYIPVDNYLAMLDEGRKFAC